MAFYGAMALIFLVISIFVFIAVIPTQLASMTNESRVDTSQWNQPTRGLYALVPLVIVGFVLFSLLYLPGNGGGEGEE